VKSKKGSVKSKPVDPKAQVELSRTVQITKPAGAELDVELESCKGFGMARIAAVDKLGTSSVVDGLTDLYVDDVIIAIEGEVDLMEANADGVAVAFDFFAGTTVNIKFAEMAPVTEGFFAIADTDGDGKLSIEECKAQGMTEAVFHEIDADSNGLIDKDEFQKWTDAQAKAAAAEPVEPVLNDRQEIDVEKEAEESLDFDLSVETETGIPGLASYPSVSACGDDGIAYKAGIREGMVLVSIEGTSLYGLELPEIGALLKRFGCAFQLVVATSLSLPEPKEVEGAEGEDLAMYGTVDERAASAKGEGDAPPSDEAPAPASPAKSENADDVDLVEKAISNRREASLDLTNATKWKWGGLKFKAPLWSGAPRRVESIAKKSPAAAAGIQVNDVILSIAGTKDLLGLGVDTAEGALTLFSSSTALKVTVATQKREDVYSEVVKAPALAAADSGNEFDGFGDDGGDGGDGSDGGAGGEESEQLYENDDVALTKDECMSNGMTEEQFNEFDGDGNGTIDRAEFQKWMADNNATVDETIEDVVVRRKSVQEVLEAGEGWAWAESQDDPEAKPYVTHVSSSQVSAEQLAANVDADRREHEAKLAALRAEQRQANKKMKRVEIKIRRVVVLEDENQAVTITSNPAAEDFARTNIGDNMLEQFTNPAMSYQPTGNEGGIRRVSSTGQRWAKPEAKIGKVVILKESDPLPAGAIELPSMVTPLQRKMLEKKHNFEFMETNTDEWDNDFGFEYVTDEEAEDDGHEHHHFVPLHKRENNDEEKAMKLRVGESEFAAWKELQVIKEAEAAEAIRLKIEAEERAIAEAAVAAKKIEEEAAAAVKKAKKDAAAAVVKAANAEKRRQKEERIKEKAAAAAVAAGGGDASIYGGDTVYDGASTASPKKEAAADVLPDYDNNDANTGTEIYEPMDESPTPKKKPSKKDKSAPDLAAPASAGSVKPKKKKAAVEGGAPAAEGSVKPKKKKKASEKTEGASGGDGGNAAADATAASAAKSIGTDSEYATMGRLALVKMCNERGIDCKEVKKDIDALRRLLRMADMDQPKKETARGITEGAADPAAPASAGSVKPKKKKAVVDGEAPAAVGSVKPKKKKASGKTEGAGPTVPGSVKPKKKKAAKPEGESVYEGGTAPAGSIKPKKKKAPKAGTPAAIPAAAPTAAPAAGGDQYESMGRLALIKECRAKGLDFSSISKDAEKLKALLRAA
jgi:Ca2+-binding EF-hand superfamily protein